jgi:hypothetical protein
MKQAAYKTTVTKNINLIKINKQTEVIEEKTNSK